MKIQIFVEMKKIKLSDVQDAAQAHEHISNGPGHSNAFERNSGIGREVNPMKIDLVLETMFRFCSVDTLKNCRLVSKQWNDLSLKLWRDNCVFRPGKKAEGLRTFRAYLELLQSEEDPYQFRRHPFRNFQIQFGPMEYLKGAALPVSSIARRIILSDYKGAIQLKSFLSKFHSLECLELENCDWNWGHGQIQLQPSNVKRLRISRSKGTDGWDDWESFLKCFPKLEALSIENRPPKYEVLGTARNILHAAMSIRTAAAERGGDRLMSLNELEVVNIPQNIQWEDYEDDEEEDEGNRAVVRAIADCRFPLERLSMHLFFGGQNDVAAANPLLPVLESCRDTLTYLKTSYLVNLGKDFTRLVISGSGVIKLPLLRMTALKEVHLSNGPWGLRILADLALPNLEKLVVANEDSTVSPFMDNGCSSFFWPFSEEAVYGKLKTFEFIDNRKIPKPEMIKFFGRMMPNLVSLTMPLDKYTFGYVCEHFKGLKTLNVLAAQCRFVEMDDDSITGISEGMGAAEPRKPNLTDLTQLTDLSIGYGKDLEVNANFTDHSVINGLLELPQLKSLSIGFKEISDENKAKLLSHVRGIVHIQVKKTFEPASYCNFNILMM